jgi:hypothetical protein
MIHVTSKLGKPFSVDAWFPYGAESLCAGRGPRRTLARNRSG